MESFARLGTSVSVVVFALVLTLYARLFAREEAAVAAALPGQLLYSDNLGFPVQYLVLATTALTVCVVGVLLWQLYALVRYPGKPLPNPWNSQVARVVYVISALALVGSMLL